MKTIATENIVIAVLARLGVVVLIVIFVYVLRQIIRKECHVHRYRGRNGRRDFTGQDPGGTRLTILASTVLADLKVGDSISINGTCLTVVAKR